LDQEVAEGIGTAITQTRASRIPFLVHVRPRLPCPIILSLNQHFRNPIGRTAGVAAAFAQVQRKIGQEREECGPEQNKQQGFPEKPELRNQHRPDPTHDHGETAAPADLGTTIGDEFPHQACREQEAVVELVGIGTVPAKVRQDQKGLTQHNNRHIDPAPYPIVKKNRIGPHRDECNHQKTHGNLMGPRKSIYETTIIGTHGLPPY